LLTNNLYQQNGFIPILERKLSMLPQCWIIGGIFRGLNPLAHPIGITNWNRALFAVKRSDHLGDYYE